MDFNAQTLVSVGNWTILGGTVADPGGSDITVGGNLAVTGVDLIGSSTWSLSVTGSATIRDAIIAHCYATTPVIAVDCIDGGNNSHNILFTESQPGAGTMGLGLSLTL